MKRNGAAISTRGDQSIRARAYALIQQKISRGELAPGSPVSEVLLAGELGSSRTPIREALGQLVAEGLLEQTPNRGTVVVQLGRQDIVDLYELREALEVYAVGKTARQSNPARELEHLNALAEEILKLRAELKKGAQLDAKQMHRFLACDLGFHTLLLRMASNARILKIVNETRLMIRIFSMHRRGHDAAMLAKIHRYHKGIAEAIAKGDSARATELMSGHIQESRQERLAEFDQMEHEASLRKTLPVFLDVDTPEE